MAKKKKDSHDNFLIQINMDKRINRCKWTIKEHQLYLEGIKNIGEDWST